MCVRTLGRIAAVGARPSGRISQKKVRCGCAVAVGCAGGWNGLLVGWWTSGGQVVDKVHQRCSGLQPGPDHPSLQRVDVLDADAGATEVAARPNLVRRTGCPTVHLAAVHLTMLVAPVRRLSESSAGGVAIAGMLAVAVLLEVVFAVSMVRLVLQMIGRHAIVILGPKLL